MLPSGKAMPRAGRMRPKTMSGGSCTTPRQSPVSTSTLSTTLVNRPKKPFQSPGTHHFTSAVAMTSPLMRYAGSAFALYRRDEILGFAHPAEDAALRLDHLQGHDLELGKIRAHA